MRSVKAEVKKVSLLSYVAVTLLIIIVSVAMWQGSLAYFKATREVEGSITIGEIDFQIIIDPNKLQTEDDGIIMPTEVVYNNISVINSRTANGGDIEGLSDFYLKIKPDLYINYLEMDSSYLNISLLNPSNWVEQNGEYYYKGVVAPGEEVFFTENFWISKDISNSYSKLPLDFGVTADVIQAGGTAGITVWTDAPTEWIEYIGNL